MSEVQSFAEQIRAYALSLPEAWEDYPWGESVAKVGKKVFAFYGQPSEGRFGLSVKLPRSFHDALELPGASPTGYGLGKSGWVSIRLEEGALPELAQVLTWVRESYVAVAPRKLSAKLA